jgi:hypothetical protein
MEIAFSLIPGFSPVPAVEKGKNRFYGFSPAGKPLKRPGLPAAFLPRLKPGANERNKAVALFCDAQ